MATPRASALIDNALLVALKNKRQTEVLSLLEKEVTINSIEQSTGKTYLHYAAKGGSTEVAGRLLELGAEVNKCDKDGHTPLHLAVMDKHEAMVALLVSRGANLTKTNKMKQTPLLLAINSKYCRIVEMLLRFEKDVSVTEWDWAIDGSKLGKQEKRIIEAMEKQCELIPGIKNNLVHCGIIYVKPNKPLRMNDLQIDIVTENIQSPFAFQCDKIMLEFTNIKPYLKKREEFFSDMYECRTWGCKEQKLKLIVTVNDFVPTGRQVKYISIENSKGNVETDIDSITDDQNNQATKVAVYVSVTDGEYSKFAIATVEKEEKIKVSKEAVVLKPALSPGTEIAIQENTFDKDSQISLKVMDTEETNIEEELSLIATNALSINTTGNVQPAKDVSMKIPIHTQVNANPGKDDLVVWACKDDHPDSVEDWEVHEPLESENIKSLSFNVNHFSLFVGVARYWTQKHENKEKLYQAIVNTIARKKKVVMLVVTKPAEGDGIQSVTVHCVSWKKQRRATEDWTTKGYSIVVASDPHVCNIGDTFQIELSGNISELYNSQKLQLPLHSNRDNIRDFSIITVDKERSPEGKICIQRHETKIVTETVEEIELGCFGKKNIKVTELEREREELIKVCSCELRIIGLPKENSDDGNAESALNPGEKLRKMFNGFRFIKRLNECTTSQE